MKKIWIIIAIMIILFGIGAYFIFSNGNNATSSSQQYQTLNARGAANNSALQQTVGKYSSLDLTPGQPQTDAVPSVSTNIPAP